MHTSKVEALPTLSARLSLLAGAVAARTIADLYAKNAPNDLDRAVQAQRAAASVLNEARLISNQAEQEYIASSQRRLEAVKVNLRAQVQANLRACYPPYAATQGTVSPPDDNLDAQIGG